jgi:HAD superfamily hydrolase (TIGR01509 family)
VSDLPFEAVLFDCDGVLVDSEAITLNVLRLMLAERGWVMEMPEVRHYFLGRLVRDNQQLIEERTGQAVTPAWMEEFLNRRDAALAADLQPISGIADCLARVQAGYGHKIACASGADRRKIALQLNRVGLMSYFEGRCFSGFEQKLSKPAPDVYLAAALDLGVDIKRCAVIEDSPTGIQAGVAAGATVFAFISSDNPHVQESGGMSVYAPHIIELGAKLIFHEMHQLPALLGC